MPLPLIPIAIAAGLGLIGWEVHKRAPQKGIVPYAPAHPATTSLPPATTGTMPGKSTVMTGGLVGRNFTNLVQNFEMSPPTYIVASGDQYSKHVQGHFVGGILYRFNLPDTDLSLETLATLNSLNSIDEFKAYSVISGNVIKLPVGTKDGGSVAGATGVFHL